LIGWYGAAFGEAFLLTRDRSFADSAQEMNDWLCTLQYRQTDPRRALWFGGFQSWQQGRPQMTAPTIHAALNMETLVQGCRVARETGDIQRYQTYKQTLERCGLFLTALQYNGSNTQHFHPRYREPLLGGFHPSHQDGTLRLDYTQEAVCGLLKYLQDVAENP
jgi:hypothetical protein